ncbi:955_t:CDS:2, partial [Cetraspora pellucida]
MAKVISQQSKPNLAVAYDLVIADLFSKLKRIKSGGSIKIGLYFYGQQIKSNEYLKLLPVVGGLAFGLNTLNNQLPKSEPSGLMKMVGQSLPFLPLLFEQFTGQKIPQMGGTMFEIQMALNQILSNQQDFNRRLTALENNTTQQFTNLTQQVQ